MRFFLVDRIHKLELGKSVEGAKCWSMSNDVFNDHFPGLPVVPGVLVIESMAQLLGTLVEKSHLQAFPDEHGVYAVLSIVHKAKFKGFMIPGDKAEMVGTLSNLEKTHGNGTVKAKVDGKLIAQADLTFSLLSKKDLPSDRLAVQRNEYFEFLTEGSQKRKQGSR